MVSLRQKLLKSKPEMANASLQQFAIGSVASTFLKSQEVKIYTET